MVLIGFLLNTALLGVVDPVDLLDENDPWLRAWAEERADQVFLDPVDMVLERSVRVTPSGARREAVVLAVEGALGWREEPYRFHLSGSVIIGLRVAWDAWLLGPPSEALFTPREERQRLRSCMKLRAGGSDYLSLRAVQARARALGCGGRSS